MGSGGHCGDDDAHDHAHGHGHSHGAAEPADGAAHGHGHSHGDGAGTPLVATDAKDGIVYYTAPDGRMLHSHDGCVRALSRTILSLSRTFVSPFLRTAPPVDPLTSRIVFPVSRAASSPTATTPSPTPARSERADRASTATTPSVRSPSASVDPSAPARPP